MKFDLATKSRLSLYIPSTDAFVLDYSKLNEGKLGSSSSLSWVSFVCDIASIEINRSISVDSGVFMRPQAGTMSVTAKNTNLDPASDTRIRPNVQIKFEANNGTTWYTVFQGWIDDILTTYDVDGNTRITIQASDALARVINTLIPAYVVPDNQRFDARIDATMDYVVAEKPEINWAGNVSTGVSNYVILDQLDVNAGEMIYSILDGESGMLIETTSNAIYASGRDSFPDAYTAVLEYGNVHTDTHHVCISDPEFGFDTSTLINSISADLTWDASATVSIRNQVSIDLWGERPVQVSLDLASLTDLQNWANDVTIYPASRTVKTLSSHVDDVKTADLDEWFTLVPAYKVNVHMVMDTFTIDEDYTVIGVTHRIDPENWYQTLQLWKVF